MKRLFKNISLYFTALLVLFLSIGISFSKMSCSLENSFYFGIEAPVCSKSVDMICDKIQETVSCCMKEIETTCCFSESQEKTCNSDTQTIHFDFETLITELEVKFQVPELLSLFNTNNFFLVISSEITYSSSIPPPKLYKPELSKIQSFLL